MSRFVLSTHVKEAVMANRYKGGAPATGARPGPPMTAPGNTRSFDMRPKSTNHPRNADPRNRAIRPEDPLPDTLLDPDLAE